MRTVIRWSVSAVLVAHGLIHVLGAAKGLGWAHVPQLQEPISFGMGVVWLTAAVLVAVAGVLLAIRVRWWWVVGAVAAAVSQSAILPSWSDAGAGTVANIILLAVVVYGYASEGPTSLRAEYRHRVNVALIEPITEDVVTTADLAPLPEPVAAYLRRSGALGQPRVRNFRARIHGRIRAAATKPWMSFTGEQVNTYGAEPSRMFFMDATMFGLPVDIFHLYVGPSATMRVKVCSMVPMVKASGPAMDRAETLTLFNDLCILAPAALVDARVSWRQVDDNHVRGEFTNGANTVTAELVFNDNGDLIDFVSDDRLRASQDGHSFTPQRWSTPVHDHRAFGSRRVITKAEARWHAPDAEGEFAYLELSLDEITYNLTSDHLSRTSELSTVSV